MNTVTEGNGCKRVWNLPILTREGRRLIESSEAVIIIGPSPPFTEQAFKVASRKRIPVTYVTNAFVGLSSYFDNILTRLLDSLYERLIYRRRLKKSGSVFAQTEGFARYLNLRRPVGILPFGIRHLPEANQAEKERRVLFVGQFRHYKGIRYLIEAAEIIRSRGDSLTVDIAGSGPLLEWIKKQIRVRDLGNTVNIIASPDDRTLAELYSRDSVFVLPSVSAESFGFVLLEAAMHNMRIITSDLPGPSDLSKTLGGEVVHRRSASELADKILEAMMDSSTREMPDLSEFSWEKNVRVLETAVERTMTRKEGYINAASAEN